MWARYKSLQMLVHTILDFYYNSVVQKLLVCFPAA